jgi:hypothetical protein
VGGNDPSESIRDVSEESYVPSDDDGDDSEGGFSEYSDTTSEDSILRKEIRFCSYAALPAALGVCHESRAAALGLYPLCFASETHQGAIRFNFSIDTIFFDDHIDPYLYQFLNNLSPIELSELRSLAIMEDVGHENPDGN